MAISPSLNEIPCISYAFRNKNYFASNCYNTEHISHSLQGYTRHTDIKRYYNSKTNFDNMTEQLPTFSIRNNTSFTFNNKLVNHLYFNTVSFTDRLSANTAYLDMKLYHSERPYHRASTKYHVYQTPLEIKLFR